MSYFLSPDSNFYYDFPESRISDLLPRITAERGGIRFYDPTYVPTVEDIIRQLEHMKKEKEQKDTRTRAVQDMFNSLSEEERNRWVIRMLEQSYDRHDSMWEEEDEDDNYYF